MKSLADQIVVVTGAGGGFGQELTRQLVQAGSHLILADRRSDMLPHNVAAIPNARGSILGTIAADLSDPAGADALFDACQQVTPRVDMLINNAGLGLSGLISDIPQAEWERLMQVNLLAPMRLTARFLPQMIERRSGHIVNIASVAGLIGPRGLSAYAASKFGLRGFGEALAADVRGYGIDVTILYPFFARTAILDAPQYGEQQAALPTALVYEPDLVIRALVQGIQRRQLHVYPGAIPRWLDLIRRLAPWLLPLLDRSPRTTPVPTQK